MNAVRKLKAKWEYLVAQLHSVDRMADPSADDALEEEMEEMTAANQAWREAERELLSSSASSPEDRSVASTTSPVPNPIYAENGGPSMIDVMREPYRVLRRYLDATLPQLPSAAANSGDVVGAREDSDLRSEKTARTRHSSSLPSTRAAPSEDPRGEGVFPPASSAPPRQPTSIRIQNEASGSQGTTPSAPSTTPGEPTTDNTTASTSGANTTSPSFRFNGNDEAILLGHTRAKGYLEAIKMLPEDQQRLVLTTPAEIAAVRRIHPRPRIRPVNKGTRKDDDKTENRKTRTHIGDNGVETELWVCRASFKVKKGCRGIDYLESPCGYPVGTKDSWVRHLKDVHLGRVNRDA